VVGFVIGLVVVVIVLIVFGAIVPRRSGAQRSAEPVERLPRRSIPNPLAAPKPARPGGYDWDRRTHQLYRAWKHVPGPDENRDAILAFLDAHTGVEAFVEPRTVMHPLSVVLVDGEGQWTRFELKEDAFLRELARDRRVPVFDASRVGYPDRMRRRRANDDEDDDRSAEDAGPTHDARSDDDAGPTDDAGG
jgi:hypothetical protein